MKLRDMVLLVLGEVKKPVSAMRIACAVTLIDAYGEKVEDFRWESFEELVDKVSQILKELEEEGLVADP